MHVLFYHVTPITDILYVILYSVVMLFYFQPGDTCALCSDKSCSLEVHHDYLAHNGKGRKKKGKNKEKKVNI